LSRTLSYSFPDLGKVDVTLNDESDAVCSLLCALGAESEDFERLDQLGALRTVRKASHHSRWEYMMLQLHLIEQLSKQSALGFRTSVNLPSRHEVSSVSELMKSWVFLNNYGHLKDTLEAERLWLSLILDADEIRAALLGCLTDAQSRELSEAILDSEDLFGFHLAVALVLLDVNGRNSRHATRTIQIEMATEMVHVLMSHRTGKSSPKEGSTLDRALRAYDAISQLAYVLLDINATPLFLRVHSGNMVRTLLSSPDLVLFDTDSEFRRTVDEIDHLLFREVYADVDASKMKFRYVVQLRQVIDDLIVHESLTSTYADGPYLATRLNEARQQSIGRVSSVDDASHLARVTLLGSFPFERNSDCRYHSEQKNLEESVGGGARFLVTPTPYDKAASIVDVFVEGREDTVVVSRVMRVLVDYVLACHRGDEDDDNPLVWGMMQSLQELLVAILRLVVSPSLSMRFVSGTSPFEYHVDLVSSRASKRRVVSEIESSFGSDGELSPERKWELEATLGLIRRRLLFPSLVAGSNIVLYDSRGVTKAEFDGVVVGLADPDNLTLTFVEAKTSPVTRRSRTCSDQLVGELGRAGVVVHKAVKPTRCKGYAYCTLHLSNVVVQPHDQTTPSPMTVPV